MNSNFRSIRFPPENPFLLRSERCAMVSRWNLRHAAAGIKRMARKNRPINLPAPYLKRLWLDPSRIEDREAYPYCLPFLSDEFELSFDKPITIIVGENG